MPARRGTSSRHLGAPVVFHPYRPLSTTTSNQPQVVPAYVQHSGAVHAIALQLLGRIFFVPGTAVTRANPFPVQASLR